MCSILLLLLLLVIVIDRLRIRSRARARLRRRAAQLREKRFSLSLELLFELCRAIAIAAGPRFSSVFVPAVPARVRILDREQFEILFPIRPLFFQRRIAETRFYPGCEAILIHARLLHIVLILVAGD